jgi:hypothetical protein
MSPIAVSESQQKKHRVLIAAAVAAIFGNRAKIQHIEYVAEPVTRAWIEKGRHAAHSHNLTKVGRSMPDRRTETR